MEYDAFLSFRGADSRNDFMGHLNNELCRRKIKTYIDNQIPPGDEISEALLEAIQKSRMSIVVLSPDYASSGWCLDEAVQIVECMETNGQLIHTIFLGIDPSEARNRDNGCYIKALEQQEGKFENNKMKVRRRKLALFRIADLPGSHYENGPVPDFIEGVVEEVHQKLNGGSSHLPSEPEPHRLPNIGSRADLQIAAGRIRFGERDRDPDLTRNLTFPAPSSKDRGKSLHRQLSMEEMESFLNEDETTPQQNQIWAERKFAQQVERRANQGSISKQFEGGSSSIELKGNCFGSILNGINMEGLFVSPGAETSALSCVQGAGNLRSRPRGETDSALQLFFSKGFSELMQLAGSEFIQVTLDNLLNLSEDEKISMETRSGARKLRDRFIQWSKDYENANIIANSTTAHFLKYSDLVERLETTDKESREVSTSAKGMSSQLAFLEEEKSRLEEQLVDVTEKIVDLTSRKLAALSQQVSLLHKRRELEAKLDDLSLQRPILRANQEASMLTKAEIEAEWSKHKDLFGKILMKELGSS